MALETRAVVFFGHSVAMHSTMLSSQHGFSENRLQRSTTTFATAQDGDTSVAAIRRRSGELSARLDEALQARMGLMPTALEATQGSYPQHSQTPNDSRTQCSYPPTDTQVVDLATARARVAALEQQAAAGDLWERRERAEALLRQLTGLREEVSEVESFCARREDLAVALELLEMEARGGI